jgi:protein gp37
MGIDSKIAWTDHTANFWLGCSKIADGCTNCYASAFANRIGADVWGRTKPRRYVASTRAMIQRVERQAAREGTRPRIFVSSLSDFFDNGELPVVDHHGRPLTQDAPGSLAVALGAGRPLTIEHLREAAWQMIDAAPHVDFLILTKRPQAVRAHWYGDGAHRRNVWLGVSAATDAEYAVAMQALDELRDLARYTFISAEPLIAAAQPRFEGDAGARPPDWVIVGGESGPHARPCQIAWIQTFVRERARCPQGPRLYVKQLGDRVSDYPFPLSPKGGDPAEWPADLRIREFPG